MTNTKMYPFEPITGQDDEPDERANKLGITRGERLKAYLEDPDPDVDPPRWARSILRMRRNRGRKAESD